MRLDKEFKRDVDKEVSEGSYIFWKVGIRMFLVAVVLTVILTIGSVALKKYRVEKDREIFKQSVTYTESAASFLADSYKQFNEADTDAEKNTIKEYVIMRYPNLDVEEIDNSTLRNFYKNCLNGGR